MIENISHLSTPNATTAPQNIGRENATSFDVYRKLHNDIVTCKLKPNERLRFDALRQSYQAGVGTLREALSHLVSDGLVTTEVGRGFRVAPVSPTDLIDITEWRVDFEVRAIVESIKLGDETWEAEIVTAFHLLARAGLPSHDAPSEEWAQYGHKHTRFHESLLAGCKSPWLLYFRSVLVSQSQRYQALVVVRQDPLIYRNDDEHRTIMEAVLDRDAIKSAELIEAHIRNTTAAVLKELGQPESP